MGLDTLRLVLLADTNFSNLNGSWIWWVLTLAILSLATRMHDDLVGGKFPDATIGGYKITELLIVATISTRL